MTQSKYVKRVIKQVNDFWSKREEGYIDWKDVGDDFEKGETKSIIMAKYGFTAFQYKILKNYMVGK